MTKPAPSTSMISIYSGRECLGHVLARGRQGYEGFDVDNARRLCDAQGRHRRRQRGSNSRRGGMNLMKEI
jgi:hypothetical protein